MPSLETDVPFTVDAKIFQRERNTLSAIVDRGGPVQVYFFGVPKMKQVRPVHIAPDNGLKIVSLLAPGGNQNDWVPRPQAVSAKLGRNQSNQMYSEISEMYGNCTEIKNRAFACKHV